MDWVGISNFIERFGIPLAILAAIGWFIIKKGWPLLEDTLKNARADRIEERDKFLKKLDDITSSHERVQQGSVNVQKEQVAALGEVTSQLVSTNAAMREITEAVKAIRRQAK